MRMSALPAARGPLSGGVTSYLSGEAGDAARERLTALARDAVNNSTGVLEDDDLQLALYVLYELAYGGFDGVDDSLEWDPTLLHVRATIEDRFEQELRTTVSTPEPPKPEREAVARALFALTSQDDGPSLSRFIARKATNDQAMEFVIQRSVYHLKEADPHSWALPRLRGKPKAALIEIQADEYGGGRPELIHAELYALLMRSLGLDDRHGAYVDAVPAITLASVNMMSLFGLHRRLRGAICGHLAAFEMTSSIPSRFTANGLRRLGYDSDVTWYFDEHVEADAVHEQIAARDLAGGLAEQQPELLNDILFGATAYLTIEGLVAKHILEAWEDGRTSLRAAADQAA